jgi:opacity protein-like surface antigen
VRLRAPNYAGLGRPSYGYGASTSNIAFVAGGQLGYNWQSGPEVFGVETDFDYRSGFGSGGSPVARIAKTASGSAGRSMAVGSVSSPSNLSHPEKHLI